MVTIAIGIAGSLLGGFLWKLLTGADGWGDFDIGGIIIAVVGAMILLASYRRFAMADPAAPVRTALGRV